MNAEETGRIGSKRSWSPNHQIDFLHLWKSACERVPFPWLYYAEIHPDSEGRKYGPDLSHSIEFAFRIDNRFAAILNHHKEGFSEGILRPWAHQYRFNPVSFSPGFISIKRALEILRDRILLRTFERNLELFLILEFSPWVNEVFKMELEHALEHEFENLFCRLFECHHLGPFHSAAFYQKFSVEFAEPYYMFRLHGCRSELGVGARTGNITFE